MAKKVVFKYNRQGFTELRQSQPVQDMCLEKAKEIQGRCPNIGYEADLTIGKDRAVGMVKATTYEALIDNLRNNTLEKAKY